MLRRKWFSTGLTLLLVLAFLVLASQFARAGSPPQVLLPDIGPRIADFLSEGFEGTTFPPAGWGETIVSGGQSGWTRETSGTLPSASPHTGAAMASFNSATLLTDSSDRLFTPVLNFSGQTSLALQFWMHHDTDTGANDRIQLQLSTDGGLTYPTTQATLNRYDGSDGWKLHTVDLSAYVTQTNARIGFLGISGSGNNIFIDDVRIGVPVILTSVYMPLVFAP